MITNWYMLVSTPDDYRWFNIIIIDDKRSQHMITADDYRWFFLFWLQLIKDDHFKWMHMISDDD